MKQKMFILILTLLLTQGIVTADVPNIIDFNGRLADSSGNAVNATVNITFKLYDVETGGTALWTETQSVTVTDGLFNVKLGSVTALDENDFSSSERWIGISVDTDSEMTPRTRIAAVPYALQSGTSTPDNDWTISGNNVYHENGNVGIGTSSTDANLTIYSTADQQGLTLRTSDNTYDQGIRFRNPGGGYTWNIYRTDALSNQADLIFANGLSTDLSNLSPKVTFQHGGNVGIGTTSPGEKLSVVGKIRDSNDVDETEYIEFAHDGDNSYINWDGDGHLDFRYNNTTLASVTQSGNIEAEGQIKNVTDPTEAQDAATKSYVDANTVTTYEVGDFAQGGIVFFLDETGLHGLACAIDDQNGGSGIQWFNGTSTYTEAIGIGIYAGEMNTTLIIANQGHSSIDYAAGVCANYTYTQNSTMYGDWYLPSKNELNRMYTNKATINATAAANGGSAIAVDYYWSSTEIDNVAAWVEDMGTGTLSDGLGKGNAFKVRAIRAF